MTESPPPSGSPTPPLDYKPSGYQGPPPDDDSKNMAMLCHLLALLTGFIGPLIIWLIKKDMSPFVDDQGKEALNFQITMAICFIIAGLTTCIFIGIVLVPAVAITHIVLCIMAAMKARSGVAYRYPFALRLIK